MRVWYGVCMNTTRIDTHSACDWAPVPLVHLCTFGVTAVVRVHVSMTESRNDH